MLVDLRDPSLGRRLWLDGREVVSSSEEATREEVVLEVGSRTIEAPGLGLEVIEVEMEDSVEAMMVAFKRSGFVGGLRV